MFISASGVFAQGYYATTTVTDTIPINFDNRYSVSSVSIIPLTEKIILRGKVLNKNDYKISYQKGSFSLSGSLAYSIFDTLYVSYDALKLSLKKNYSRRSLVVKYDEETGDTIKVFQSANSLLSSESIFGRGIQKSGTLVRGFTVGTTRDFTVSSGLRLQLSGQLSEDIEIVAALTDENSPIQPEGNTERLEELDKVFIQVRHPNAIGTFGDFDLNERIGEFGLVTRKLKGLKSEFIFDDYQATVAIAGSRGKFNTNQFNGTDGLQGPYRLNGINNERDIIVIAGSEKVFIDGEQMKRGENNDYVIEYSSAELTFTPQRVITSSTRITVDFEYTDRQYDRNFFGANFKSSFFDDKLKIKLNYAREGDNEGSPIDLILSESDIKILEDAGDDRFKAVKTGVALVPPDSTGRRVGIYTQIDTTLNGESFQIYKYAPGDTNSVYSVKFSQVGNGNGDYVRESLGNYTFIGIGQGDYLPINLLPLPQLKQMGNILIEAEPFKDVNIGLELAGSLFDKNTFSKLDGNDDGGAARTITLNIKPRELNIGNISFGKAGLTFKDRFVHSRFTSLDRFNDIEFNRDYNVGTDAGENEQLREFGLKLIPVDELNVTSKYGFLKRGESLTSNRFLTDVNFSNQKTYNVVYDFDYVETKRPTLKSNWTKQLGDASYQFGKFRPGVNFLSEEKKDKIPNKDSLSSGSLKYLEGAPYIEVSDISGFSFLAKYSIRDESFPIDGQLEKESRASMTTFSSKYRGIKEVSTSLDLTVRKKKFTDKFKQRGLSDNETVLIKSQTRLNFWNKLVDSDIFYEASTKASSRLEKVFIKVPRGDGNYIFLGDLNNNGLPDESEFEQVTDDGDFIQSTVPTTKLFPVIELKASTRWKFDLKKLFRNADSFIEKIVKPISTETFLRVEENSTVEETSKIYLMKFSNFLNDSTTIRGFNQLQQDIHLFRNRSDLSLRFRYIERENLNRFTAGIERGSFTERSLRLRFKLVKEVSNQTEIINQSDNVSAPASSNRARQVSSNSFNTDFSYRPIRNLEVGFKVSFGRIEDNFPTTPTVIDNNFQSLRFNLSFAGKGRIRAEAERDELLSSTTTNAIPFEVTRGKVIGKNYRWRFSFDYRVAANFQTTVSYDGRKQGEGKVVHTMRAEARAYF
ncbi:MAG: hypothetical protein D8M61_10045 [Ignavibacteriae bacterium]|nr:hypothetical protein [Ignavibacteriota bacterium]